MALSYDSSGVKYEALDAFKRACQRAAATTTSQLAAHRFREPESIRGESAYLIEGATEYFAHVEEGLGTKNLVADAVAKETGRCFYRNIGIDTVATMVNDLVTTGAMPVSIAMHAAVGDSRWFDDTKRAEELASGFAAACIDSGATWGGGETPALSGIVNPDAIVLAGSALGRIAPKSRRIKGDVCDGDAIIFIASNGVHTNGLTLCRKLVDRLPQGYRTMLSDGRSYGEALLDPSVIYVKAIRSVQDAGIAIHYAAHVTGHGWRKLMRLDAPCVYRVDAPGSPGPIFSFIEQSGPVERREMYATFNMGVGFVLYLAHADADHCIGILNDAGYRAWIGGTVIKEGSRKAVEIPSLAITFDAESLKVR